MEEQEAHAHEKGHPLEGSAPHVGLVLIGDGAPIPMHVPNMKLEEEMTVVHGVALEVVPVADFGVAAETLVLDDTEELEHLPIRIQDPKILLSLTGSRT